MISQGIKGRGGEGETRRKGREMRQGERVMGHGSARMDTDLREKRYMFNEKYFFIEHCSKLL